AVSQTVEQPVAAAPERFELAAAESDAPVRPALETAATPAVRAAEPAAIAFATPTPRLQPAPAAASPSTPLEPANPELLLAGMRAAVRSGAWASDVTPEIRNGRLTFSGLAGSPEQRSRLQAALEREAPGAAIEIALADRVPVNDARTLTASVGDRPAGGLMRSALLAHYGDAARRSFQQPTPTALDGEIARFTGEVYRNQSSLVRHAHALSELLTRFDAATLTASESKTLDSLIRFHAEGVADAEAQIYGHLSEALPRRYWNHRGDRSGEIADSDAAASAHTLLADALRLDETLTTLLGASPSAIDAGDAQTSVGGLLYSIRTRARILTSGLDSDR
ncbi:MAG: hypothetical protein KDC27_05855, partial [Acidobacteria bacterium]|nr:hypothetical protein [Acidobacteriota bacterium]